jgi:glycosyltransferase involved in cell wall biosynthesis
MKSSNPSKNDIRICHIIATTEGATWVFEQLRDLRNNYGYDVTVILNGNTGSLVDRFKSENIRVLVSDFDFLNSCDLLSLPKKIWSLKMLLEREHFDVVQTHLFHSMVIGRFAAWLADAPVRLSMVAGPFHLEAYTPRWIDATTQWMETSLIPSCEFTRTLYKNIGVSEDRLETIYYGPDEEKFDPGSHSEADLRSEFGWPKNVPLIGMVAYFYPELGVNRWIPPSVQGKAVKCQADLIKAMPSILAEFPSAKLIFVGSGWTSEGEKYLSKMQALVDELELSNSIKFTGYRNDIPSILKSVNVCVQASLSENLGGSIEGLLMECPMVASRVGGLVDSVIDEKTGILVEPNNPQELATGILKVLHNPDKARMFGISGRQYMLEKFTLRKTVEAESALYKKLMSKNQQGYRFHRQLSRLLYGSIVCLYISLRYCFFDLKLLPLIDAGWRPWHLIFIRTILLRIINSFLNKMRYCDSYICTKINLVDFQTLNRSNKSEKFITLKVTPPPELAPRFSILVTMMLYRFYSFIGNQKLGWGIRKKIMNIFLPR